MRPGILVATPPGRAAFRYAFTPADTVWLGRLLAAGAGGQYRGRRHALLWTVFSRFGWRGGAGMSFGDFVQRLAPSLQRIPWNQLPHDARRLAIAAVTGALRSQTPNVYVMARGYSGSPAPTYPYGQQGARYGWRGETEMFESDPPASSPSTAAPAAPGSDSAAPQEPPMDTAPSDDGGGVMPDAGDSGGEPPMADEPAAPEPAFPTQDGNTLVLNPGLLNSLTGALRRRRHRRYPPYPGQPYPYYARPKYANYARRRYRSYTRPLSPRFGPSVARPFLGRPAGVQPLAARRALVGRFGRLARGARRIGTLRGRRSGQRFPVFGGRVGGKNYRIVARPRGGVLHEIMMVHSGELQQELG